jgi:hypothetical protein
MMRRDGKVLAYMWAEPGAEPFALVGCSEAHKPGIRARRLSGHVHTWKTVRPEHGILFTSCPPATWIAPGMQAPNLEEAGAMAERQGESAAPSTAVEVEPADETEESAPQD